jgi:hydrogenase maturation protease
MIVIGLGNEFRGDDGAGLSVARQLRDRGLPAVEHEGDPAWLMERWNGASAVILIDAVRSGSAPGTLHRFDVSTSPLPRDLFKGSTHTLDVADAVELSRALGTLPARVLIFGIEAGDFGIARGLSSEVETALPVVVEEVVSWVSRLGSPRPD